MTIAQKLHEKLTQALLPSYLNIINESDKHHVPKDAETHFKIIIVSEQFNGLSLVKRHQKVYAHTKEAMYEGLHALSLHTFTPEEWDNGSKTILETPNCQGGS